MKKYFPETRELISLIIMSGLVFFAALPFLFYLGNGYLPKIWLAEDGLYESVAALACIVTAFAMVWFVIKKRASNKLMIFWLISFSFALFILGGEEISWGQRIIGFDTPEGIAETNYQNEFNLHNSTLIQSHNNQISDYLAKLLVIYLVIFSLFLYAFPTVLRIAKNIKIPIPSLPIALAALVAQLLGTATMRLVYGAGEISTSNLSIGEAPESILELCLCWVAWIYMYPANPDK